MQNQNPKPDVTPPASYTEPSLPTLAALGMLAVATTLATGCVPGITAPPREFAVRVDTQNAVPPDETNLQPVRESGIEANAAPSQIENPAPSEMRLEGDIATPGEISAPEL